MMKKKFSIYFYYYTNVYLLLDASVVTYRKINLFFALYIIILQIHIVFSHLIW